MRPIGQTQGQRSGNIRRRGPAHNRQNVTGHVGAQVPDIRDHGPGTVGLDAQLVIEHLRGGAQIADRATENHAMRGRSGIDPSIDRPAFQSVFRERGNHHPVGAGEFQGAPDDIRPVRIVHQGPGGITDRPVFGRTQRIPLDFNAIGQPIVIGVVIARIGAEPLFLDIAEIGNRIQAVVRRLAVAILDAVIKGGLQVGIGHRHVFVEIAQTVLIRIPGNAVNFMQTLPPIGHIIIIGIVDAEQYNAIGVHPEGMPAHLSDSIGLGIDHVSPIAGMREILNGQAAIVEPIVPKQGGLGAGADQFQTGFIDLGQRPRHRPEPQVVQATGGGPTGWGSPHQNGSIAVKRSAFGRAQDPAIDEIAVHDQFHLARRAIPDRRDMGPDAVRDDLTGRYRDPGSDRGAGETRIEGHIGNAGGHPEIEAQATAHSLFQEGAGLGGGIRRLEMGLQRPGRQGRKNVLHRLRDGQPRGRHIRQRETPNLVTEGTHAVQRRTGPTGQLHVQLDKVRNPVIIGVGHHRIGSRLLFLDIAQDIAIGILQRIRDAVIVRVHIDRTISGEILVVVVQPIAIGIGIAIDGARSGDAEIGKELQFPGIGEKVAVTIGHDCGDRRINTQIDNLRAAGQGGAILPFDHPVFLEAHGEFLNLAMPPGGNSTDAVGMGSVIESEITHQIGFVADQRRCEFIERPGPLGDLLNLIIDAHAGIVRGIIAGDQ